MARPGIDLQLKPEPDGYGFIYGELRCGNSYHTVNIMPPASEWRGDIKLDHAPPHETDWVLYFDGEEVAPVRKRDDIAAEFTALLT